MANEQTFVSVQQVAEAHTGHHLPVHSLCKKRQEKCPPPDLGQALDLDLEERLTQPAQEGVSLFLVFCLFEFEI